MGRKKLFFALIIGISIGLIIGSLVTFFVMKSSENKEISEYKSKNLSITQQFTLEIKKLTLKNTTYDYVDDIENKITSLKEADSKYTVVAGMYMLKEEGTLKQVDEKTLTVIDDGATIKDIDFGDEAPKLDSMVYINEKGKVSEAVFYVEGFQIKYDLLGTKVTQIEN